MRCALLTADNLRHKYFANKISKVSPEIILYEKKPNTFAETKIFDEHLKMPRQAIAVQNLNKQFTILKCANLDYIFIFGCRILSKEIISCAKIDVINIHTGLTQFHRGVDAPHWAFIENKPELVGHTIHSVTPGIDDGKVYAQKVFKNFEKDDTIDSIFLKNCKNAIDHLSNITFNIISGRNVPQKYNKGKLYQSKDMSDDLKTQMNQNLSGFLNNL